jgi:hypothetical protein
VTPSLQWGDAKTELAGGTQRIIVNSAGDDCEAQLPGITTYAPIPQITNEKRLREWLTTPMQWWQCQVNFAVWCASAGCGVGVDHLHHSDPLIRAMYRFHLYYQVSRVLVELKAPYPTDTSFDAADNPYDARAFEGLCRAFGTDPNNQSMFRVLGPNSGAGQNYF